LEDTFVSDRVEEPVGSDVDLGSLARGTIDDDVGGVEEFDGVGFNPP